jgi:hypothetical protein
MITFTKLRLHTDETLRLFSILNVTVERRIYDEAITQALDNLAFQLKVLDMALKTEESKSCLTSDSATMKTKKRTTI